MYVEIEPIFSNYEVGKLQTLGTGSFLDMVINFNGRSYTNKTSDH